MYSTVSTPICAPLAVGLQLTVQLLYQLDRVLAQHTCLIHHTLSLGQLRQLGFCSQCRGGQSQQAQSQRDRQRSRLFQALHHTNCSTSCTPNRPFSTAAQPPEVLF